MLRIKAVISYALRRIDPDLWRKVKGRAAHEGRTVRFVILALLRLYARHGLAALEALEHPRKTD